MLNQQTVEKLHALRLTGMADAYRQQMEDAEMAGLSLRNASTAGGPALDLAENQAMARAEKVQAGCGAMRGRY
jgi:hypothetical protein